MHCWQLWVRRLQLAVEASTADGGVVFCWRLRCVLLTVAPFTDNGCAVYCWCVCRVLLAVVASTTLQDTRPGIKK